MSDNCCKIVGTKGPNHSKAMWTHGTDRWRKINPKKMYKIAVEMTRGANGGVK